MRGDVLDHRRGAPQRQGRRPARPVRAHRRAPAGAPAGPIAPPAPPASPGSAPPVGEHGAVRRQRPGPQQRVRHRGDDLRDVEFHAVLAGGDRHRPGRCQFRQVGLGRRRPRRFGRTRLGRHGSRHIDPNGLAFRPRELQPAHRSAGRGSCGLRFRQHLAPPPPASRLPGSVAPGHRLQPVRPAQVVGHRQPGPDLRGEPLPRQLAERLAGVRYDGAQAQLHPARRQRRQGQHQLRAAERDRHRARGHGQRNPGQVGPARRPRLVVPERTRDHAQLAGQHPEPETLGLQFRPVLAQDLLGPRPRQQPEHHERVGHRLPAERHAGSGWPRRARLSGATIARRNASGSARTMGASYIASGRCRTRLARR